jgi:hypothetical protein
MANLKIKNLHLLFLCAVLSAYSLTATSDDSFPLGEREAEAVAAARTWAHSEEAYALAARADIAKSAPAFKAALDEFMETEAIRSIMQTPLFMINDMSRLMRKSPEAAEAFRTQYRAYVPQKIDALKEALLVSEKAQLLREDRADGIITIRLNEYPEYAIEIPLYSWPICITGPEHSAHCFPCQNIAAACYAQTINNYISEAGLTQIDPVEIHLYKKPGAPEDAPVSDEHFLVITQPNKPFQNNSTLPLKHCYQLQEAAGVVCCSTHSEEEIEALSNETEAFAQLAQLITHAGIWCLSLNNATFYYDEESNLRIQLSNVRRPALGGSEAVTFYRRYKPEETRSAYHDVPEEMLPRGYAGMDGLRKMLKEATVKVSEE